MSTNTDETQPTNCGDGTSPAVVGHPPNLAYVKSEAGACHLKIGTNPVGVHFSLVQLKAVRRRRVVKVEHNDQFKFMITLLRSVS